MHWSGGTIAFAGAWEKWSADCYTKVIRHRTHTRDTKKQKTQNDQELSHTTAAAAAAGRRA